MHNSIDTQLIRDTVNVRDLIGRDLGNPRTSNSKYDLYRCPLHREQKGYSLAVYADHWKCFGKCNESGDAIKWMQTYHHMAFQEACLSLLGNSIRQSQPRPQRPKEESRVSNPPNDEWQHYANQVVDRAQEILWSPEGRDAMNYLQHQRGLGPEIIDRARLGFIPGSHKKWHVWNQQWLQPDGKPVIVPCGISIPHFGAGNLWAVKVRRAAGDIKYQGIPGGAKCLYWVDEMANFLDVFVTEGEFDCLLIDQCAGDLVSAVALGSASNSRIDSRWFLKFASASNVFARLDDDEAGQKALARLGQFTECLRPVQVPMGKDVTDFYLSAGRAGFRTVRQWVKEVTGAEERIQWNLQCAREAG